MIPTLFILAAILIQDVEQFLVLVAHMHVGAENYIAVAVDKPLDASNGLTVFRRRL